MGKKFSLALKVMLKGLMIVEMIRSEICEYREIKLTSEHSTQIEAMGGDFHDHV